MKKLILSFLILAGVTIAGCRKDDNPKLPDIQEVPQPQFTKDATGDLAISVQNPDSFSGKFNVGLYFPDDIKPAKFDIVVMKNGDAKNAKTFKKDITTFPTVLTVTGIELKALFGGEVIMLGDKFDFGATVTTTNGKVYPAFTEIGLTYGSAVSTPPGASPIVRFEAICKFLATDFGATGVATNFVVVTDGWKDYTPGSLIPVTVIDATHISFKYGTTDNVKPIVITVDPNTNETSVSKAAYGDYGDGDTFSAASVAGSLDNFVAPCELTISVRLSHTSASSSYGNFVIKLKKK